VSNVTVLDTGASCSCCYWLQTATIQTLLSTVYTKNCKPAMLQCKPIRCIVGNKYSANNT